MSDIKASAVQALRQRTGLGMMECKRALVEAGGDAEAAIAVLRKSGGLKAAKVAGRTAAEGRALLRIAGGRAVLLEVNCETDFVARGDDFGAFCESLAARALELGDAAVEQLMDDALRSEQQQLIQNLGENIQVRRVRVLDAGDDGVLAAGYSHGNDRIAAALLLRGGDEQLGRDLAMHIAALAPRVLSPQDMPQELLDGEREIYRAQARESGKSDVIVQKMVQGRLAKFLAENSLLKQPFVKDADCRVEQLLERKGAQILQYARYEVGEGMERAAANLAAEVAAQLQGSG